MSTITLNYWLSVFFLFVPALIFWIIEKDKGNRRATEFHIANLNFALLRTGVWLATVILVAIMPVILDFLVGGLLWVAQLVLFIFHIMAAVKAPEEYRNGGKTDPFLFNTPMVK